MCVMGKPSNRRKLANSHWGSAARILGMVLSVLALAGFALLNWPQTLGGKANWTAVSGQSMLPNYRTGDMILTWRTERWGIGDNVLYSTDGTRDSLIFHRLINGNTVDGWQAKGDNNPGPDPSTVPQDRILGVELFHIPKAGYALTALKEPVVILAVVVLSVLFYALLKPGRRRRLYRYPVQAPASLNGIPAVTGDLHAEGARFHLDEGGEWELGSLVSVEVWLEGRGRNDSRILGILTVRYDYATAKGRTVGGPIVWSSEEDITKIINHIATYFSGKSM